MSHNEQELVSASDKKSPQITPSHWGLIPSRSPALQALERMVRDLAATDIPVLLLGESGTGKELFALWIHEQSARRKEPFLKVNCTAATAEALTTTLHAEHNNNGHSRPGTILLDDVSELEPASQRVLLSLLPDDAATRNNGTAARLISATSLDLEEAMRSGHFRRELFYRINGVCLRLPPLRERKEDIPGLVDVLLAKQAALLGRSKPELSADAINRMLDYSWPGNIRELENVVKRIIALGDEETVLADLKATAVEPLPVAASAAGISLKVASRAASLQAERELILKTLTRTRWNRKRAAQELQISYKSLLYKLKQIGFPDSEAT